MLDEANSAMVYPQVDELGSRMVEEYALSATERANLFNWNWNNSIIFNVDGQAQNVNRWMGF